MTNGESKSKLYQILAYTCWTTAGIATLVGWMQDWRNLWPWALAPLFVFVGIALQQETIIRVTDDASPGAVPTGSPSDRR